MNLNPNIFFNGNAEEALEFYREALGGRLEIVRYKDAPPGMGSTPDWAEKVMYGQLVSPFGAIAAMDAPPGRGGGDLHGFGINIYADTEDAAASAFEKLSRGGSVTTPLEKTFFAEKFGMVHDKYGVTWMVTYRLVPAAV
jgi:PhnB protein